MKGNYIFFGIKNQIIPIIEKEVYLSTSTYRYMYSPILILMNIWRVSNYKNSKY